MAPVFSTSGSTKTTKSATSNAASTHQLLSAAASDLSTIASDIQLTEGLKEREGTYQATCASPIMMNTGIW